MINNNEEPGNDRDYAESDISDNQKEDPNQEQQSQPAQSQNDKDASKEKSKPVYIKDMPEIKPAISDQGV